MISRGTWASIVVALLALVMGPGLARAQTGTEIMEKNRQLHRLRDEQERQVVKIVSKTGAVKERIVMRYTLTGPDDLNKSLVRFLLPRDVENTALLTWEARDGNADQWLYLPATKKPKRIAASGKKNRFMGTDFSYEDLVQENLAVHRYRLVGRESVDGQECYVVEAVPATERQAADTGYSKRRIWVRTDNHLVIKRELYDRAGRLEKVETRRKLVNVRGTAWRADEAEMQDVQQGTKTVVVIESRSVERGLTGDFFTEAELTRGGS